MPRKSLRKRLRQGEYRVTAKGNRRSNAFWRTLPDKIKMPVPVKPRRRPFDRSFDDVQMLSRHNYATKRGFKKTETGVFIGTRLARMFGVPPHNSRRIYGGRGHR